MLSATAVICGSIIAMVLTRLRYHANLLYVVLLVDVFRDEHQCLS